MRLPLPVNARTSARASLVSENQSLGDTLQLLAFHNPMALTVIDRFAKHLLAAVSNRPAVKEQ